jgi:BirA family biotin operon repressor/biotin-[acetyl-CoA-carboxylase] ligase
MWRIETCEEISSTQDGVREALERGEGEGYCLRALKQYSGRGRQGRQWVSLSGNLFFSFLIKPYAFRQSWGSLSLLTGLALVQAIGRDDTVLKWPNDVMVGGLKCAGILIELEGNAAIIGVGVNIAMSPAGFSFLGDSVEPDGLLADFLARFADLYARWQVGGFAAIRDDWMKYAYKEGAVCSVKLPDGIVSGYFGGVDENGALLLHEENDVIRTVTTGEIIYASGD